MVRFTAEEESVLELCAYSFNYDVDYSRGYRQKEIFVVTLKNISFLGNSGAIIVNNKVVVESVFDQLRLTKSPAFRSPAKMQQQQKRGVFSSIMHLPWAASSNYHWFLDCLPRLMSLLQEPARPMELIVPKNIPAYQLETLKFFLADRPEIKLVYIGKQEKWELEEFIMPSFINNHYSGYLPPDIVEPIRKKIWEGYKVIPEDKPKRIFISRQKASKRQILNEVELFAVAKQHGFELIFAEDLTYQQQVQLFYNAEYIIGAHGAGLTNTLFSKKAAVLELHPSDIVKSHYFMLCKGLGFAYQYLLGSKSDENQSFSIEVEAFRVMLGKLLVKEN
ncbi:glycosyltransferase family 61 protein [Adhaeribacter aquaticus]|uniref:glycosyltransferase family 61 protein n=1 Tax=Adhaeribacter aquaticus TaxID=299567 RepID=UPI00146F9BB3|nr:glycosyltransferase family 61 protein [Adhaeribacter aquaticus]